MNQTDPIHAAVRETYGAIAESKGSCCGTTTCCATPSTEALGYSPDDLEGLEAADLALGCGNPLATASLAAGETVLDLGSGGGLDCFLAARAVGSAGRVIGVDMTPQMVELARRNAGELGADNVDFRLGEIEHLPLADASVDVVLSNCVINLSPDKEAVFREAFRVLRPGGRLAVADVVTTGSPPQRDSVDPETHCGCVEGAAHVDQLRSWLAGAGFRDVRITPVQGSQELVSAWYPDSELAPFAVSARIEAVRP